MDPALHVKSALSAFIPQQLVQAPVLPVIPEQRIPALVQHPAATVRLEHIIVYQDNLPVRLVQLAVPAYRELQVVQIALPATQQVPVDLLALHVRLDNMQLVAQVKVAKIALRELLAINPVLRIVKPVLPEHSLHHQGRVAVAVALLELILIAARVLALLAKQEALVRVPALSSVLQLH